MFLSSEDGYLGKILEFPKRVKNPFEFQEGTWAFYEIAAGPPQACRGEFSGLRGVVVGSLGFLSSCVSTWGTRSCLLREVRSSSVL